MASKIIVDQVQKSGGTAFTLPTSDGSNKSAVITDGSGALSFATGTPSADNFLRGDGSYAEAGGGLVLKVKETSLNTTVSTSSTSYVTTGLSITTDAPASTSSRFILTLAGGTTYSNYAGGEVWTTFYVGGSEVSATGPYSMIQENDRYHITMIPNNFFTNSAMMVHSPASVSAQTYAVFFKANSNTAYFNLASSRVVFTVMELSS